MNAIQMKNLTKYYGKQLGVKDLNLSIDEGSIYGFIGPNGAGKSTTLRMLMNIIFPSNGSATVLGKDIVRDAKDIKYFVGYLPSEINLYEQLRVEALLLRTRKFYEQVAWKDNAILANWENSIYHLTPSQRKKAMNAQLDQIIDTLQLDVTRKIADLSFGNKKKMGIALSMLHKPKILILDEPTGGLDPLIQDKYFDLLRKANEQGSTIFFSSHILSEVEKICDHVAIIKDGLIIRSEGIESLKEKSLKTVSVLLKERYLEQLGKALNLEISELSSWHSESGNIKVTFTYPGTINCLLSILHSFDIQNLNITEPTLEQIFMHYYM